MNFKDLITDTGFLTEKGKEAFAPIKETIQGFIPAELSIQELSVLGSVLMKEMAEIISAENAKLLEQEAANEVLWKMSDDEFSSFLKNKYGDLEGEALLKPSPMTADEIKRHTVILGKKLRQMLNDRSDLSPIQSGLLISPTKNIF
jgi:hypothetical protein